MRFVMQVSIFIENGDVSKKIEIFQLFDSIKGRILKSKNTK